jgi:hypothetical protein
MFRNWVFVVYRVKVRLFDSGLGSRFSLPSSISSQTARQLRSVFGLPFVHSVDV